MENFKNINTILIALKSFTEDSAERADLAENQLNKLRAKNRSSISANRTSPTVSFSTAKIQK